MSEMHRRELVRRVARRSGTTQAQTERVMAEIVGEIAEALAADGRVVWTGLCTFEMRDRSPRGGVNPKTHERIVIGPRHTPGCTMNTAFKDLIAALRDGSMVAAD